MAGHENGKPVEDGKSRVNGHAVTTTKRRSASKKSRRHWLYNSVARLFVWYALLTILFRCPSQLSALDADSPKLCKPYLSTYAFVQPHLQPYYDTYAGPYVEKARPYVDYANTRIVRPVSSVAATNYKRFAAPQLDKAKAFGQAQWEKALLPQVRIAQERASSIYESNLASHVQQASTVVGPYYETAKDNAVHVHYNHLLPAIAFSKPHAAAAYASTEKFVLGTALPLAQHALTHLSIFIDGTLWPFMKSVYSHNVRPQLVMISERIAKYQEGRKIQAAVDEAETSITAENSSLSQYVDAPYTATVTSAAKSISSIMSSIAEEATTSVQSQPSKEPEYATDETIEADLTKWQKKFGIAAEKGTDDLKERIQEIVESLTTSDIDHEGRGLATALRKSSEIHLDTLKSKIKSAAGSISDDADESELTTAEESVIQAIREAGLDIKTHAEKVRSWEQSFRSEITQRTLLAAESTLQVLDSIRDLGLQEIGMRWAWMEGVTYKHWQKYHDLRKHFEEWRNEVRNVALQNPDTHKAIEAAREVMEESMAIMEDAANELIRIKDVARWKIRAHDDSDDFSDPIVPAFAASASSQATEAVADVSSSVASAISGIHLESVLSGASLSAADIASSLSSSVLDGTSTGKIESVVSEASASLSSAVVGTSTPLVESVVSSASSFAEEVQSSASSVASIVGEPASSLKDHVVSSASSVSGALQDDVSAPVSSVVSKASSKIFVGAMAQDAKEQVPILDDVFDDDSQSTFSEQVQSFINEAGDKYAEATEALREALYGTSQGTVESVTSLASEQYQSALLAASSVLYGTPTPAAESVAKAATDRYKEAVAAASSVIFATKSASISESLIAQANAAYSEAVSRAQEYRSAAEAVVSGQMNPAPKPIHSQMLESISQAYAGAVANAGNSYNAASRAAASQYSSLSNAAFPTQNAVQSVQALASAQLQSALYAASSQYLQAKIAVGATPAPALQQAQASYYAAIGYAHEQYSTFLQAGSAAVYGAPTPAYQSLVNQASSQYSVVAAAASSSLDAYLSSISSLASKATKTKSPAQSLLDEASSSYSAALSQASGSLLSASEHASIAIFGSPAPVYQQYLDSLNSQYAAATAIAAQNLNDLLESASSAVGSKKKTPVQSVLDSISSQYSDAILAASSNLNAASSSASFAFYGSSVRSYESVSSIASENWEQLVARASERVYGQPTPVWASVTSQVGEYSSQATDAAAEKYLIISAYVSEIIVGREPDFSESVMSRLSAAYYTGLGASASSIASEAYASGASLAASVSSVAASYFTPPAEVDSILDQINAQLNSAVDAASIQFYGSQTGSVERATSAAAEAYASASSAASEAIYGTDAGYAEAIQSSMADAASSAQDAISALIFGTPTGTVESATAAAAQAYQSISSAMSSSVSDASESAASVAAVAKARISEAIYGPEAGAMESASLRISKAVESARSRLAEYGVQASGGAEKIISQVSESVESAASIVSDTVESAASVVSSGVSSASSRVRDEL